ncbi:hypothetical protein [Streptomyces sp. NPDC047999]|uniref:hypothetical protein n=1 Tax=Streptomyces sp. NPDC047999 TaxID=3365497 RepID=UPI00371CE95F
MPIILHARARDCLTFSTEAQPTALLVRGSTDERLKRGSVSVATVWLMTPERAAVESVVPTPGRSRIMAAIRRRDTRPERSIRSLLHAAGKRYRVVFRVDLEGARPRPDIAFTRARVAVFVDGCFWHSCPEHGTKPGVNQGYWQPKLVS